MSLYYKSLNSHMKKFRKGQNFRELSDELHNLNLKEQLNQDLNKEQALLSTVANKVKRDELKQRYAEHLKPLKEKKLKEKAEKAAKLELLKEAYKYNIGKTGEDKLIGEESKRLKMERATKKAAKRAAKNALFDEIPQAIEVVSHPYGTTKSGKPRGKPGIKFGGSKYKSRKV